VAEVVRTVGPGNHGVEDRLNPPSSVWPHELDKHSGVWVLAKTDQRGGHDQLNDGRRRCPSLVLQRQRQCRHVDDRVIRGSEDGVARPRGHGMIGFIVKAKRLRLERQTGFPTGRPS
jgi:hypothetical protein